MQTKSLTPVVRWLFLGYFLIFVMVIVGGVTRLTGSGLSMADWKPIMGAIPPLNEADWLEKFELYKATPEYKIVNNHFSLEEFKSIFWWEFIHRDLGRLIGLVFIIPFAIFWFQKRFDKSLLKKMLIILGLGALQGLLGWYMVSSGLVDKPHVSHFRLAAHFITALSAMLYIFWVATSILFPHNNSLPSLNRKTKTLLILVVIQLIYGAFTAGLKAGFGNYIFTDVFAFPSQFSSFINDGPTVLFTHRYLAIIILIYTLYLYIKELTNIALTNYQKKGLHLVLGAVFIQVVLGILTLLNSVPISLGVIHQAGAVIVITSCVYLIRRTS
ncbi:MAG: COX15/CtaA family protein [Flavobacteriales bacterium]|jgi:cytochrome c oxidase assembly protein subunit 15|nr:COX15/CtaA family protein [Flavobacteriales bacterium]